MNLLADESVDRQIVERLRQDGYEVLYIAEIEPSIADETVFDRANEMSAVLITTDKDFGEIVFRDNRLSARGVILLRLSGISTEMKGEIVSRAFLSHEREFSNSFSVIEPGRIRIRGDLALKE